MLEVDERERWESIGASESYGPDRVGARGRREGKTGIGQDRQVAGRKRGKWELMTSSVGRMDDGRG